MAETSGALAALDCGTNSTRLLIAGPEGELVDRQMRVTRLGQGVDTNRKLSPEAIERTLGVLREYRRRMDDNGVTRARMVATSAARDASNSEEFLAAAKEVTGVEPELLSGEEEGRLSFRGATSDLRSEDLRDGSEELVVDIGGGSTELVVGVPGGTEDAIRVLSLDIGCVRVTERFFDTDPPGVAQLAAARAAAAGELARARELLKVRGDRDRVIGLAGTVSTLGSLSKGLESYDRGSRPPHGSQLRRSGGLAEQAGCRARVRSRRATWDGAWTRGRHRRGCADPFRGYVRFPAQYLPGVRGGHPRRHGGRVALSERLSWRGARSRSSRLGAAHLHDHRA